MKRVAAGFKIAVVMFICLCFIGIEQGIPLAAAGLGVSICLVSPIALYSKYRLISAKQRADKQMLFRRLLFMESFGLFPIVYAWYWHLELSAHASSHDRQMATTVVWISIAITVLLGIRATYLTDLCVKG